MIGGFAVLVVGVGVAGTVAVGVAVGTDVGTGVLDGVEIARGGVVGLGVVFAVVGLGVTSILGVDEIIDGKIVTVGDTDGVGETSKLFSVFLGQMLSSKTKKVINMIATIPIDSNNNCLSVFRDLI